MKKLLTIIALSVFVVSLGVAQTLLDNGYYRRSVELQQEAQQAFDEGDYDAAADYAAQAKQYLEQSDAYVAKMLKMDEAKKALADATQKMEWAESIKAATNYPDAFGTATTEYAAAKDTFAGEAYDESIGHSKAVLTALALVKETVPLPAYYVVRRIPGHEDCYWRIAAYPFVYNNPILWPKLYAANKSKMRYPDNPNLIYPGMVMKIPSVQGEVRSGTWDPKQTYAPLLWKKTRKAR